MMSMDGKHGVATQARALLAVLAISALWTPVGAAAPIDYSQGHWIEQAPYRRFCAASVFDPLHRRIVVFDGGTGSVTTLDADDPARWESLEPLGTPPPPLRGASAAYDAKARRMIVFGTEDEYTCDPQRVWSLTLDGPPAWSEITPGSGGPGGSVGAFAVYDSKRQRVVLMGGSGLCTAPHAVWTLSLTGSPAWGSITPAGTAPTGARFGAAAIYDPPRDRVVFFGGGSGFYGSGGRRDLWAIEFKNSPQWVLLSNSPVYGAGVVGASAAYDPGEGRMLIHGGLADASEGGATTGQFLAYQLRAPQGWVPLAHSPDSPRRHGHSMAFDPIERRLFVHGGNWGRGAATGTAMYSFQTGNWSATAQPAFPGRPRFASRLSFDSRRERMIITGGYEMYYCWFCPVGPVDGIYQLELDPWPKWVPQEVSPPGPSARTGHSATYVPSIDRLVLFGGAGSQVFGDLWTAYPGDPIEWREESTLGPSPSPRRGHSDLYDSANDRVLVYGGCLSDNTRSPELWQLSMTPGPAWTLLAPMGTNPPGSQGHTTIEDPIRHRLILLGGDLAAQLPYSIWTLPLAGPPLWTRVPVGGIEVGNIGSAWYERERDRIVAFTFVGLAALDLSVTPPRWSLLQPTGVPPPLSGMSAGYDPVRRQAILFGGVEGYGSTYEDLWALRFLPPAPGVLAAGDASLPATGLRAFPNPSSAEITIRLALPRPESGDVLVFDLAGRRVRSLYTGPLPAGTSEFSWDGADDRGMTASEGVYWVRARHGGDTWSAKVVRVR